MLTGLVAMALGLAVFGSPALVAQADTPTPPTPNLLTVHKHCVPIGSVATFDVTIDFEFEPDGSLPAVDPPIDGDDNPNTAFDVTFPISCGDEDSATADGDVVTLGDGTGDIDLAALFDWYEANSGSVTSAEVTLTEAPVPGVSVIYAANFGQGGACSWTQDHISFFADPGLVCVITNDGIDAPNITVTKVFEGEPTDQAFEFTLTTDAVEGCAISVDGGPLMAIVSGGTFFLQNGQSAELACPTGIYTITETAVEGITLDAIDCTFVPPENGNTFLASGSFSFSPAVGTAISTADCTFTNVAVDTLDIIVMKECVGEFEATFEITVGAETRPLACGATEIFADLEPGPYDVTETIEGGDEEGFGTVITCDDTGESVEGTSATVTLEDVDVTCVIVNGIDVGELICPCGCGCLNLDLEIDNTNTNTIGIDNSNTNNNANNNANANDNANTNENTNDNVNENTQDQNNTQDQTNDNTQANNIDSSPEVNIDFD